MTLNAILDAFAQMIIWYFELITEVTNLPGVAGVIGKVATAGFVFALTKIVVQSVVSLFMSTARMGKSFQSWAGLKLYNFDQFIHARKYRDIAAALAYFNPENVDKHWAALKQGELPKDWKNWTGFKKLPQLTADMDPTWRAKVEAYLFFDPKKELWARETLAKYHISVDSDWTRKRSRRAPRRLRSSADTPRRRRSSRRGRRR